MLIIDDDFVREHTKLIRYLITTKIGGTNREEMDDLFTDTIVKCIKNAGYYDSKWAVSTFIGLQVRSAVRDFLASKTGHSEDAMVSTVELMPEHDRPEEEPETDSETMEYLQEKLRPYLHVLSDNERQVITLHVWNRVGVSEIADKLGMHPTSVSSIKTRAENKLTSYIAAGKRMNPHQEVDADVPLEHAIKQLPDPLYHAYRLHHLKGWSITRAAAVMGRSMMEVASLVGDAKREIRTRWGYRA